LRPSVTKKVEHLRNIVKQIDALPPLQKDGFNFETEPVLRFEWPVNKKLKKAPWTAKVFTHNARAIHVNTLKRSIGITNEPYPSDGSEKLKKRKAEEGMGNDHLWAKAPKALSWTPSSSDTSNENAAARRVNLERLGEIGPVDYVVVFRTVELKLPVLMEEERKFYPGSFVGEALLFEVDSEQFLGGVRITAMNQKRINSKYSLRVVYQIIGDLGKQINKALTEQMLKHFEGNNPAFNRKTGQPLGNRY